MTEKILFLTNHVNNNKRDVLAYRKLTELIHKRRKLMNYLRY